MKLFRNNNLKLRREDLLIQDIIIDDVINIYCPVDNKEILSNFEGKYEERKVTELYIVWMGYINNFVLSVTYDNGDIINLTDENIYTFVLTDEERGMLSDVMGRDK